MKVKETYVFDWLTTLPGLGLAIIMWVIFWLESKLPIVFYQYGIKPRTFDGLKGVFLAPFIHGDLGHLWSNTMPIVVLGTTAAYFYRESVWKVFLIGIILTGLLTWLLARDSYHIGASGLIYMLVFFLFFKGVISRYYRLVVVSLLVVFFYGSTIWYLLPIERGISWEGHLSGAITGIVLSLFIKHNEPKYLDAVFSWKEKNYNPDEDDFLKQFDSQGNFFEIERDEEE